MEYILKENLIIVLNEAINNETKIERLRKYSIDSALLAGWKSCLEELKKNNLEIKYE